MTHIVRFRQALTLWKEQCFLQRAAQIAACKAMTGRARTLEGSETLIRHHEFEDYVRKFKKGDVFDRARFSRLSPHEVEMIGPALTEFPETFARWTAGGRRVFRLEPDTWTDIGSLGHSRLRWSDIAWPLRTFAISLKGAKPSDVESEAFDLALYGLDEKEGVTTLTVLIFSMDLGSHSPIGSKIRRQILKNAKRGRKERVYGQVERIHHVQSRLMLGSRGVEGARVSWRTGSDERMEDTSLERFHETDGDSCGEVIGGFVRLGIGLCLHLERLPPGSGGQVWREEGEGDGMVVSVADICDVQRTNRPGADCDVGTGKRVLERCRPIHHTRSAHDRRIPARNGRPARIIRIEEMEINLDLKSEDGPPAGSMSKV